MVMSYIGGKAHFAQWIISEFPKGYQEMSYVEPFGGAGWVLFKKEPSKLEVWNDINSELFNMFRQIIENYEMFKRVAIWMPRSREWFSYILKHYSKETNQVKRAVYFAYILSNSFGGKGTVFGVEKDKNINKWFVFLRRLRRIYWRFINVIIENLDYKECIQRYDTPNTLFYLDPPYISDNMPYYYRLFYNGNFTVDDHLELVSILKSIKGKFLLSYWWYEPIMKAYEGFNIVSKASNLSLSNLPYQKKHLERIEILIKNY